MPLDGRQNCSHAITDKYDFNMNHVDIFWIGCEASCYCGMTYMMSYNVDDTCSFLEVARDRTSTNIYSYTMSLSSAATSAESYFVT